jgi:uncharacterized protein YqeY
VTIPEKIRADLREAMGRREGNRTTILRLILSEIKNAEISCRESLSDDKVIEVISTEVKRHRESIEAFKKGSREDLVALEENELSILLSYLPEQLGRDEITIMAQQTISEIEAKGMNDRGKVMSQLMPKLKGRANGREASDIVNELLLKLQALENG